MFNVGGGELLVIMLVALIVLGPQRLPEAARTVGKVAGEVRRLSSGFQREVREALDEADAKPARREERAPLGSTIAELDAGDDSEPAANRGDGERPGRSGPRSNGSTGAELAPEVGTALDQVVAGPEAGGPSTAREPGGAAATDDRPTATGQGTADSGAPDNGTAPAHDDSGATARAGEATGGAATTTQPIQPAGPADAAGDAPGDDRPTQ